MTVIIGTDRDELFDQLANAYIVGIESIRIEHMIRGECEHRENDPAHTAMHDMMREISATILLFVDRLEDIPAIADYFDERRRLIA
jgi:hypothetical protein